MVSLLWEDETLFLETANRDKKPLHSDAATRPTRCLRKGAFTERGPPMPIDFLTAAERERLNRFPEPIPDEDLRVFFTLSDRDTQEVRKQRGAPNQIGFALQLCA